MLKLVLAVCSTLGGSFGGEMPRELAPAFQAFWSTMSSPEPAWVQYYRNPRPIANGMFAPALPYPESFHMRWAVPNHMLSGAPSGPGLPPVSAFPTFPPYPPFPGSNP